MSRANARLNGEWGPKVRPSMKKHTAKLRRRAGQDQIQEGLDFLEALSRERSRERSD